MARSKKDRTTFPLSLRANEDPRIREFLELQSGGYSDVLRYLIEKEIAENGIRDLTALIPARRSIDNFINNSYPGVGTTNVPSSYTIKPQIEDNSKVEHTNTESRETKEEKESEEEHSTESEEEHSTSSKEVEFTVHASRNIEESLTKVQNIVEEISVEENEEDDDEIPDCYK
ncbi:MAG: hypothetical protein SOX50_02450 [Terrisporobacter othiniensis]|uniref:hypothetical protein n=1 Tax=Terrisporobacter othiniensis TaxID=1577792 RepID=UPI002A75B6C1|nr:hypothetical protein [Terrisporobacter othiniensis]MDY3372120.1 hypothetical protein [Terrisporobacter othiniensis]